MATQCEIKMESQLVRLWHIHIKFTTDKLIYLLYYTLHFYYAKAIC